MTNNGHLEDISSLGFSLVIKISKLKEIVEYFSWRDPFKCFVIMLVMLSSIWQDTLKVYLRFIASATPGACIHLKVYYLPSVRYKVIEILAGGSCSLVEWKLETGRTHQVLHDT